MVERVEAARQWRRVVSGRKDSGAIVMVVMVVVVCSAVGDLFQS